MEHDKYMQELIDRYFEGLTSLKEEKKLRMYFSCADIPDELKMYSPIFRYFAEERQKTAKKRRHAGRTVITSAAAACVLLFFGLRYIYIDGNELPEGSAIYIDGYKYNDVELIRTVTVDVLENMSENCDDVYSSQIEALDLFFY
jgi:hypothetical protein